MSQSKLGCGPQLDHYLCFGNEVLEIFCSGPYCPFFTADLQCYYSTLHSQLSSYTVPGSVFSFFPLWFVDILRVFPVTRIELSLSDECNVNMSYTCSGRMLTWTRCLYDEKRSSANECMDAVPYWLLCTDKRTSVCLRGLHTLLVQSSICSHVKQELQET